MVIHHAGRLHEGVTDRGADEGKSSSLEVPAHRVGFLGGAGNVFVGFPAILDGLLSHELPDVFIERCKFVVEC